MTNQDYEDHYNAVLDSEYEKITQDFIKAYNNTENGLIISERIFDFRNQLITKIDRLILIRKSPEYQNHDWYYKNLIEAFKRRPSYLKDQFFNKFFEKLVPELKETLKRNNFEILLPKIYNANNKDTLAHIAIYNAHKKFFDTFPSSEQINYNEIKDINEILDILNGKKAIGDASIANTKDVLDFKPTIEECLKEIKDNLNEFDFKTLVDALNNYFATNVFPIIISEIKVNKVNVKKFGWALNQVYRNCRKDNSNLTIDYLLFAKENISIFKNVDFDENNYLNSNLYKYFTTKT